MSATAVATVRERTDPQCHATNCSDSGCALPMSDAPTPYVLVHIDAPAFRVRGSQWHLPDDQRRCDFLFVGGDDDERPWVAPVELTTGRKEVSDFVAQICGGIMVANELLPTGIRYRFNPVGGCRFRSVGRGIAEELRRPANRANFRGQLRPIELVECGVRLADALVE